jgi:DNA-binding beta-propeller fold protein YncE
LNSPYGLAFDSSGNLYASNANTGTISEITPNGTISQFASGLNGPRGLAFDSTGNLFVANNSAGTISEISPTGIVSQYASGLSGPEFLTVQVPDPASVGILVVGLVGLMMRRRSTNR